MSQGLDILVVTPFGSMGGAERWLLDLVDHTDRLSIRAVALEDGPVVTALTDRRVHVIVRPTGASPRAMVAAAVWLTGHVRRRRPDAILANGVKAAAAAVPVGRLTGVPATWVKHDFARDRTLARPLGRMADRVLAVSPAVVEATRRTDVVLVPPTLSTAPVDAETARAFWAERGLLVDAPTVAMVARLAPIKGMDDAITALASPEAGEWRLVIIGGDDPSSPDERQRLRRLARDRGVENRVHLVGWVEDAARWLAAFDAVAILTRTGPAGFGREGFGLAALEALQAGVPIIAAGGNPEVVRLAVRGGAVVPPHDPAAVARALAGLRHVDRSRLRALADDHPSAAEVAGRVASALTATVRPRPSEGTG